MEGVHAVLAEVPSRPSFADLSLLAAAPSLECHAQTLVAFQEVTRRFSDVCHGGRRLAYNMAAKLQRSDLEGSNACLAKLRELPSMRATIGDAYWEDAQLRNQICWSSNCASFIEGYVGALGLHSFLDRGILTPPMPEEWRVGIRDFDDER